jgi:hypothetical protein
MGTFQNLNKENADNEENNSFFSQKFIFSLVAAITGKNLDQIITQNSDQEVKKIVKECTEIMTNSILNYVENKYGKTSSLRLKACLITEDKNVFHKYPELENYLDEAMNNFLNQLESTI